MSFFGRKTGGFMDEIRCDERDYLIWKWRPSGLVPGANNRENAIRWGSSLRVREGSVAVFVHDRKNGEFQDFIEGPFDQVIKTENLPVLASIVGLAYEGGTPFQAEVYFINLAEVVQIRFAVPFFDVCDPRFLDFGVPVAVRGTLSFCVRDCRRFIKMHRLDEFDSEAFKIQVRDAITRYVKSAVSNAPVDYSIPLVQLERVIGDINEAVFDRVKERFFENFGVNVTGLDIAAIDIDRESDGYRSLMAVTRDIASATTQAQADVNIKNLRDQQRVNVENLEESLRIQREEAQYAQHKQTQGANLTAFQIEQQAAVGIAGAEALGKMGSGGAMSMDAGGDGGGFNPAALMVGLAMGGAMGKNMAGIVEGMMGGIAAPSVQDGRATQIASQAGWSEQFGMPAAQTPPPIPDVGYHVVVGGHAEGSFSMQELSAMALAGKLDSATLVWKEGMPEWRRASDVRELAAVLGVPRDAPPPVPDDIG